MNTVRFGWILAGWLAGFGLAQAAMYKWVDEHGVTHYSQFPPSEREHQTVVPPPPPAADPEGAQQRLEDLLKRQDESAKAKTEAAEKRNQAAAEAERRAKNCSIARANLDKLTNLGHRRLTGPDGAAYFPTEEERQQRIAEARKQIEEYCE